MDNTTIQSSTLSQKTASVIALIIGVMSVFAGTRVLLEIDIKDYNVLIWLVFYNVIFGAISLVVAYHIWKNSTIAKHLSLFILIMHFTVLLYLKFINTTVASESIMAMSFRTSVWVLIVVLSILIPKYFRKKQK